MASIQKSWLQYARKLYVYAFGNKRIIRDNYYGEPILPAEEGNNLIRGKISQGQPLMVSRFGAVELSCLVNYIRLEQSKKETGIKRIFKSVAEGGRFWETGVISSMSNNAGFFPATEEMLRRFSVEFMEHIKNIDILGVWFNEYEDEIYKKCCPQAKLTELAGLDGYLYEHPWTEKLENKKVLVIHPFQKSIEMQYAKRQLLFKNPKTLPDFELKTIKAIQSIAGSATEYKNWFDALDCMCDKISKTDFDIAIIGAGAYGLPLASFVKSLGKIAMHTSGSTQILFGIKGKRWDAHELVSKYYNDNWKRPEACEIPTGHSNVESGCYW